MRYIYELLITLTEESIQNIPNIHELHYLIIIFLNYLLLPDIFLRNFEKSNNLKINKYCCKEKKIDQKTHSDSKLAVGINYQIDQNRRNNEDVNRNNNGEYIGVSHLCCLL